MNRTSLRHIIICLLIIGYYITLSIKTHRNVFSNKKKYFRIKMVGKILWLLISLAILSFASPVIDKLALARRFGPLKKVVSLRTPWLAKRPIFDVMV